MSHKIPGNGNYNGLGKLKVSTTKELCNSTDSRIGTLSDMRVGIGYGSVCITVSVIVIGVINLKNK